jgi:endonuclease/exonuclease/phosphatase family metal-dependent hydrolase
MKRHFLALAFALPVALYAAPSAAQTITIVSYNAENLFDTADDPTNPRDDTYLPLALKDQRRPQHDRDCEQHNGGSGFYVEQCKTLDWSDAVYGVKLQRYADVIKAMPVLPDVIVIPETENRQVLDDLIARHLPGYEAIQLDTSDKPVSRGIDVGMLTRLPLAGTPAAHEIGFGSDEAECGKTRDILAAPLRLPDGQTLHVFGVHFPSGASPVKCRIRAFKKLNDLAAALPAGSLAVAAGDYNINCNEGPTEAFTRLLHRGNWYASPLVSHGCNAPGSSKFVDRRLYNWNTWSFLDMILVSAELSPTRPSPKNWFADLGSFGTLVMHPEQVQVDERNEGYVEPRRFDPVSGRGVSDHWPVAIRLVRRRN